MACEARNAPFVDSVFCETDATRLGGRRDPKRDLLCLMVPIPILVNTLDECGTMYWEGSLGGAVKNGLYLFQNPTGIPLLALGLAGRRGAANCLLMGERP